ncbi:MAG: pilus assembly protein N-terminal domain-containing protein [Candidatus Wallbacteria bacterium]|nr:pilus assembly protein N-terminal domain-containing protein [Candidatus Wallbacteria bacterium]
MCYKVIPVLLLAITVCLAAATPAPVKVEMRIGDSRILNINGISRISIADPDVADVINLSDRELFVLAKKLGKTDLYVWAGDRRSTYLIIVSNSTVKDKIKEAIGYDIEVLAAQDTIILKGTVQSDDARKNAEEIAKAYSSKITNLLRVDQKGDKKKPIMNLEDEIEELIAIQGVRVKSRDGKIILDGSVDNQNEMERAVKVAQVYSGAPEKVINLLVMKQPYQIMIEAKIIDITDTATENLGIDWGSNLGYETATSTGIGKGLFSFLEVNSGTSGNDNLKVGSVVRYYNLMGVLKALMEEGKAHIISSPTMMTLSGQTAVLNVGGQVPIRRVTIQEKIVTEDFEYKEYGLKVLVTPEVECNSSIRLSLAVNITDMFYGGTKDQNQNSVPEFLNRTANSTVSCGNGETIVISGLIRETEDTNRDETPVLSKIPGLGKLFRNQSNTRKKSELLIFLTPHIIRAGMNEKGSSVAQAYIPPPVKIVDQPLVAKGKTEVDAVPVDQAVEESASADTASSAAVKPEKVELLEEAGRNLNERFRSASDRRAAIRRAFSGI